MRIKPSNAITNLYDRDVTTANNVLQMLGDDSTEYYNYSAGEFFKSESTDHKFHIGSANFPTRHILYMVYLAAINLCCGSGNNRAALRLLQQSVEELKQEIKEFESQRVAG